MNGTLIAFSLILSTTLALSAAAQDTKRAMPSPTPAQEPPPAQAGGAKKPEEPTADDVKPYSAVIQLDTAGPIVYGDDIVATIQISPRSGLDVKDVRITARGRIAKLYATPPASDENAAGSACRTSSSGGQPGMPVIATCRLTATRHGALGLLPPTLQGGGRHQFEITVVLYTGAENQDVATFYEFGSADFISPLTTVILGAILGAGLWALFLPMSMPFPTLPVDATYTWTNLFTRIRQSLPQVFLRWSAFGLTFLRSVVLGGATALVLIILAKTTEGLETPIAFQVNDVWGGLLVGIFSTPLSRWIRNKVETMIKNP